MASGWITTAIAAAIIAGWWILWFWIRAASAMLRFRQVLLYGLLGSLVVVVLAVNWQRRHPDEMGRAEYLYVQPFVCDSSLSREAALARYTLRLALEAAEENLTTDAAHAPLFEPNPMTVPSGIPAEAIRGGAMWVVSGTIQHDGQYSLSLTLTRLDREGGPVHRESHVVKAAQPVELGLMATRQILLKVDSSTPPCEVCFDPLRPATLAALADEEEAASPEAALKRINRALRKLNAEESPLLLVRKAKRLLQLRREDDAASAATLALARLGANATAFGVLGELEAVRGNEDEAVRLWRRAVSEDRHAVEPLLHLASVNGALRERNGLPHPEQLLRQALAARPANLEARLRLADILESRAGGRRNALELIRAGLRITGGNARLRLREGSLLIALGRYNEAEQSVRMVLDVNPGDGNAWYNLALILRSLGQLSAAQSAVQESFAHGGPVDLYYLQGLIYEAQGNTSAASEAYRKRWAMRDLTKDDPAAEAARQRLRKLH